MEMLRITESLPSPDLDAALVNALEAELVRQGVGIGRHGDRLRVAGECDLRGLVFAVMHTLTTTPV